MAIYSNKKIFALFMIFGLPKFLFAQPSSLPQPTRTVFKCQTAGKIIYSDEPCLGAERLDIEPTRGMNKSTGTERIGKDVQHEKTREIFSEAIKPLTGMTPAQNAVQVKRYALPSAAQSECRQLDGKILQAEKSERTDWLPQKSDAQLSLFRLRKRFRELYC